MRLKVFIRTTLSVLVAVAAPAMAQDPPPAGDTQPGAAGQPAEPSATPPPANDANAPSPETAPAPAPDALGDAPPAPPAAEQPVPSPIAEPNADTGKASAIGEQLSPLVVTVSFGYGYAAIKYPGLTSSDLDGVFLEMAGGTELDQRLRLLLAFTSFETPIHRLPGDQWAEGKFQQKVAGTHTTAGPTEPTVSGAGGVDVQRTLHAHSLGPRLDFLPLGAQGPYLGVTTALAITTGIDTRVGGDLGARVGGEWRPFQELSFGIEAGAHGQLYSDGNAVIPYATARLNLLLDPAAMTSKNKGMTPSAPVQQRTLPTSNTPR